ncbi:MAG: MFS transporter [Candidatus Levybacteria bacterium]|nr:MFS transporter [Candidatus Levybacteria bacterium]
MNQIKQYGRMTFSSLNIYNYRLYFIGQAISTSGTWMQNVAQGLLILQLTGSGTALGLLIAVQFLPTLFLGSFGGVIADRFSKRRILFITQTIAGVLALLHALLLVSGMIEVWMVYLLALGLGLVTAFDNPTRQTFIFEMVGKDHIRNAVSLNAVMVNIARVVGPSLAGILVPTVGLAACFFINALSFVAVLIVLIMMQTAKLMPAVRSTMIKGQFMKGIHYVKDTHSLRTVLLMMVLIGTFTYEFMVILPLLAEFTFNNPVGGYALLSSAMGFGAVIGGLISASRKKTSLNAIVTTAFLFGGAIFLVALAPNLELAAIAMVIVGMFSTTFIAQANAYLQIKSLPEMRGRVMSLWTVAFLGTTPIGAPIIGWIGENAGPRWALGVGGLAAIVAGSLAYLLIKRDEEQVITPEIEIAHEHATSDRNIHMR